MAQKRNHLVPSQTWARHLRKLGRRHFWHRHRRAERRMIREES